MLGHMTFAVPMKLKAVALSLLTLCASVVASDRVPGGTWMQFEDPAEAGFSLGGLAEAKRRFEASDYAACFVVRDGAVVAAWGDVEARHPSMTRWLVSLSFCATHRRFSLRNRTLPLALRT